MVSSLFIEASQIAERYNWLKEAELLKNGIIPEGFAKEVGQTIALFLERNPLKFFGMTVERAINKDNECHEHAKQLGRLRLLLAKLYCEQKGTPLHIFHRINEVVDELRNKPMSSKEIANKLGVSKNQARKIFDRLSGQRIVKHLGKGWYEGNL